MYFRDCKTLIVFERKIPLTLEFRFHQEWRPCIKPGFFPQISLLNISVYRLQPRLFIDSLSYLKKPKRTIKSYGSAARLGQTIVIKAWTSQNSFVGFVLFFFTIPWLVRSTSYYKKLWNPWFSLSFNIDVKSLPRQLDMVIGRKLFGSYLFPLFLNIGLMLPINHISGIIPVSKITLNNFSYMLINWVLGKLFTSILNDRLNQGFQSFL
jgi:hypothetical protein